MFLFFHIEAAFLPINLLKVIWYFSFLKVIHFEVQSSLCRDMYACMHQFALHTLVTSAISIETFNLTDLS